jgi:hypothetical protein
MEAIFRNLITKPFIGTAVIDLDGEKLEKQLNIPANSVCLEKLPLKDKIPYGRIRDIKMPVVIKEKGFKPVKTDLSFPAFAVHKALDPIKVDGNLEDWGNIPAIRLKNRNIIKTAGGNKGIPLNNDAKIGFPGDHEAEFKITWDDKHLYLLVKVNDDKFYVKPDEAIPGAWRYDCLQVYIDTQADARNRQTKGHDENDYNYNFYPAPKGNTVTVYRATTPNQQIAGGLLAPKPNRVEPEVKANFTIIKNGYFYEIAFPKRLVAPMPLKRGSIAGFSVYLADNDGREYPKSALTTTPPGTGGFRNPHLYPLMILTEK